MKTWKKIALSGGIILGGLYIGKKVLNNIGDLGNLPTDILDDLTSLPDTLSDMPEKIKELPEELTKFTDALGVDVNKVSDKIKESTAQMQDNVIIKDITKQIPVAIPKVKIPEVKAPKIKTPKLKVPKIKVPKLW